MIKTGAVKGRQGLLLFGAAFGGIEIQNRTDVRRCSSIAHQRDHLGWQ